MIKGILFDKDGTLLEFHSTQHYIYASVFTRLKDQYRVPDPLLQKLREALGHLPDRIKPDSLLPISTNPQIAEALFNPSKKYAAENRWQLPFDIWVQVKNQNPSRNRFWRTNFAVNIFYINEPAN